MSLYRSANTILKLVTNGAGIRPAFRVERLIRLQRKRNPFDPGNTERIRKRYAREMHTRFARMRSLVRQSLIENEALSPVTLRVHAGKPAKPGQLSGPADIAVAAFQAWLQKTSAEVVLGVEGEWPPPEDQPKRQWQRVISGQAYLGGLQQAAAQGAALGLPDIPAARALLQLPRHTVAADIISGRQYQLLVGVSEKMADDLRTILGDGLRNGLSVDELVDSLTSRISKLERTRARAIAQTEVTFAQNEALLNAMEDLGVQTVTALVEFATTSGNPCPFCEDLEGQVFSIDEARGVIPVHPSCFPAGVLVEPAGDLIAATSRMYSGDLLVIRTAAGRRISVTPNHPILTARGIVPAKAIQQGDDLPIPTLAQRLSLGLDDKKHRPTRVEDVAQSFESVWASERRQTADEFHGDGTNGQIAVVMADRKLWDSFNAKRLQFIYELALARTIANYALLSGFRAANALGSRPLPTSRRGVGSLCVRHALLRRQLAVAQILGSAIAADLNSSSNEPLADSYAADAVLYRQSEFGGAGRVLVGDMLGDLSESINRSSPDDVAVAALREPAHDGAVATPEDLRNFLDGRSGLVQFDRVLGVDCLSFKGHVHNLQTSKGFYFAEGIPVLNCVCLWLPIPVQEKRRAA